jgi:hypothetical protein
MPNPTPGPPPSKITHGRPPRRAAARATPQTVEAYAAIIETRAQTVAEFRRTLLDELNKAEAKAAGLVQDLAKAEQRTRFQTLTAPVDGVVQQLAIHRVNDRKDKQRLRQTGRGVARVQDLAASAGVVDLDLQWIAKDLSLLGRLA